MAADLLFERTYENNSLLCFPLHIFPLLYNCVVMFRSACHFLSPFQDVLLLSLLLLLSLFILLTQYNTYLCVAKVLFYEYVFGIPLCVTSVWIPVLSWVEPHLFPFFCFIVRASRLDPMLVSGALCFGQRIWVYILRSSVWKIDEVQRVMVFLPARSCCSLIYLAHPFPVTAVLNLLWVWTFNIA